MKHVLAPNNVFQRFILPGEVVQFSERCKTTAKRLTPEEAAEYGVSKLQLVSPPAYDALTQTRNELPHPSLCGNVWVQQWEVVSLDAATVAVNQAAAVERLIQAITSATQQRLDTFAQTRNYDGILSAATYATSTNPTFAAEGQYAVTARDNTWAALYTIMGEVQAGTRPMPTSFADIELALPVLAWPT